MNTLTKSQIGILDHTARLFPCKELVYGSFYIYKIEYSSSNMNHTDPRDIFARIDVVYMATNDYTVYYMTSFCWHIDVRLAEILSSYNSPTPSLDMVGMDLKDSLYYE